MKWPCSHTLTRFVRRQKHALDKALGSHGCEIRKVAKDCCIVEGSFAVATFAFDWRDRRVVSSIQLRDFQENIPTDTLVRFMGADVPLRTGEPLSELRVKEEVHRVIWVCDALRGRPDRGREAVLFFDRECKEYTRCYDGSL